MAYVFPIALIVVSNILYQICTKSVSDKVDPFASLTVTYLVGAAVSAVLYVLTNPHGHLLKEYGKLNWAPFVLGIVIVGLEGGYLYAYKAGWQVSMAALVQSAFLAVALIVVGFFLYKEAITWNKVIGMALCLAGLIIVNK